MHDPRYVTGFVVTRCGEAPCDCGLQSRLVPLGSRGWQFEGAFANDLRWHSVCEQTSLQLVVKVNLVLIGLSRFVLVRKHRRPVTNLRCTLSSESCSHA